jgi:hypothetical protein
MSQKDSNSIRWAKEEIAEKNKRLNLMTDIRNNSVDNPLWIALKKIFTLLRDESLQETAEGLMGIAGSVEEQIIKARKAAASSLGFQLVINIVENADKKVSEYNAKIEKLNNLIDTINLKYQKIENKQQHRYGGHKNV